MPGLCVPGLGHHLFPAPQVAEIGLVTSIDSRSCLDQGQDSLPLLLYSKLTMNHPLFPLNLDLTEARIGGTPAHSSLTSGTEGLPKFEDPA